MTSTIKTARLTLRRPVMSDAEAIALYLNDFEVSGNLARVPYPYHLGDAKAWLRFRQPSLPPAETNFVIELPGHGLAGQVGFHQGVQGTIIGYWLGPPFWGQGIMTEAVTAALDWYFRVSSGNRIVSGVFAFNDASLAIQKKLGFIETGRSTMLCLARNGELEHIDTELTRDAWMGRKL